MSYQPSIINSLSVVQENEQQFNDTDQSSRVSLISEFVQSDALPVTIGINFKDSIIGSGNNGFEFLVYFSWDVFEQYSDVK